MVGLKRLNVLSHYLQDNWTIITVPKTRLSAELPLRSRSSDATRFRWLYDEIRTAIVEGRIHGGTRLPSTRTLAGQYGVARGTVVAAFDQLVNEGYLESHVGNGTFVRRTLPKPLPAAQPLRSAEANLTRAPLSSRGALLASNRFPRLESNRRVETFRLDRPALDTFPTKLWSRIAARTLRRSAPGLLAAGETLGYRPLREAIAQHVALARGVRCTAEEVVITSGTQASLDLMARLLLDPADRVWMEDPGYAGVTSLLRGHGVEVVGIEVDSDGMDCEAGRRRHHGARLAYVTPGCQFPLGCTMTLQRRLALLEWAREERAWIFEDDYDSLLRFAGRPLAALQSLDGSGVVIYSNSFNKMLFTSLRLGFLVIPPRLIDAVARARSILDRFLSVPDQATLCEFITQGHMEQHMRRMRELYELRFEALVRSARRHLEGLIQFSSAAAGLQVVGWLAPAINEDEACRRAAEHGISSIALSQLTVDRPMPPGLVLGVGSAGVRAISRGVQHLGQVLRSLKT
jgi:GntR family transcriptional regulator/MocR family aminotransferase